MIASIPELDNSGLRRFGLTTGGIVAGLFGLLLPWLFGFAYPLWPWVAGGALCLWAIISPSSLRFVYSPWMRFAHLLGWINSRIILTIIFYILILPMGIIMQLFGKDPMQRELSENVNSYRVPSSAQPKEQMERPF